MAERTSFDGDDDRGTTAATPQRETAGAGSTDDSAVIARAEAGSSARRRSSAKSTSRWRLLGVSALGLVGALLLGWFTGLLAGKAFGPDEPASSSSPATSSEAKATGEGATPGESIKIVSATLFDPPPGDGAENADRINLSYDGQAGTAWPTLQYKGSAAFGNIKPGVGIVYDLGAEKTLSKVQIQTTIPGATVEIRTGGAASGSLDQFTVVGGPTQLQESTEIALPAGTKSQYVLVWITALVQQQGYFQASLSEVSVIS